MVMNFLAVIGTFSVVIFAGFVGVGITDYIIDHIKCKHKWQAMDVYYTPEGYEYGFECKKCKKMKLITNCDFTRFEY